MQFGMPSILLSGTKLCCSQLHGKQQAGGRHCSRFVLVMLVADVCLFEFIQLSQKVILEELNGCSEFLIELCRKDQVDLGVWEIGKKRKFLNKLVKILPSNSLDVRNATENVGKGCVSLDEMTCQEGIRIEPRAAASHMPHLIHFQTCECSGFLLKANMIKLV